MVPATNPRLVVLVVVDEPRGAIFGGVVAAPAFASIAKFDLQYLEVPPDAPRTELSATTSWTEILPFRMNARSAPSRASDRSSVFVAALGPRERRLRSNEAPA